MSPRPSALQPPLAAERYVDARDLAMLMGVSTTTIKRLVAEGMLSETWGMARTRRFLPSQAIAWAQARRTISPRDRACNARPEQPQRKE